MSIRDQAVSDYLTYIKDPDTLRDDEEIENLQTQLEDTTDVLDALVLRSRLEHLENLPEESFREPFIEHAASYAEEHGISAKGFESMGVDRSVLREAGLVTATYVTVPDVTARLLASGLLEFTQPQVIGLTGAAPGTVRKALTSMVDSGQLLKTEESSPSAGRGSKAKLYRLLGEDAGLIDNEFTTLLEENETEPGHAPIASIAPDPVISSNFNQ